MDTKKLDEWAKSLLDTGKRNNLINFRDTRASTAEVLLPSADALFEKIDGNTSFEIFDPKILEEDSEDDTSGHAEAEQLQLGTPEETDFSDEKKAFLDQYAGKLRRPNQILLYNNAAATPLVAVKNINKKAHEFLEETGVNVAYMAFGFIHWKESDSSDYSFRTPVLLVPIQLEHTSAVDPYFIRSVEDDIVVNPTFAYKLDTEYGIKLPSYHDEGLTDYLESIRKLVSKLKWTVTSECKIGIFSFLKINMYRDLKDNASAILANPNVCLLLNEPTSAGNTVGDGSGDSAPVSNPLIELHNVIDADSSQIEAIEMAKSGKSFVLQGPPGTGKSQTITNIIAECLSDGKKVLFVSEKLAALNVVYDKMKKAALAEFCLQLHSHKANKKDVIADLCHTLRSEKTTLSSKADDEILIKEKAQRQLDTYAVELHKQRPVIEKSLYQLYEAYSSFRTVPDVEWTVPQLSGKGQTYLTETVSLLDQYVDYIPSIGYEYKKNPWYGYLNQDISYQTKKDVQSDFSAAVQLLEALVPLLTEISDKYGVQCSSIADAREWNTFFDLASTSQLITPSLLERNRFNTVKTVLSSLQIQSEDILASRSVLDAAFDADIYKLDGAEFYKKLTKQFDGVFPRLFNSEYKQIINSLRLCRKDGKKSSYTEAVAITERLSYYQQKCSEYAEAEAPVKEFLGPAYAGVDTDWNTAAAQFSTLESVFACAVSFGSLERCADLVSEQPAFAEHHQKLDQIFKLCDAEVLDRIIGYFDHAVFDPSSAPCSHVLDQLKECLHNMDKLDHWCHFRTLLSELDDKQAVSYIDTAIRQNIEPKYFVGAFQKQFYYQWIDSILSSCPVLSAFNRISQDKAVQTFSEKDTEQFTINKAKIRSILFSIRPSLDMIAPGGALALLLREGEKKRKQKSIRTLLSETGELVQRIKPCFLMSPLSVSTFLAPDSVHFDVVVFDEASQIFPQDAIGAIYRADQLIVVGDSRQMPPSNFFNASVETDDCDEEVSDLKDFQSILDLCATSMRQLRLRWHYRSRFEQLIAFSNKNFYDNELITFPSSKADAPWTGVDYYPVDGIFDRRSHTNRKEAEFIVDLIYQNIDKFPDRSLGVVAFSVAQQDLIDKLLAKRRQSTPEKEFFFTSNANEPFFIKNLETVQGDERDTIIFSVAYGRDAQGRLLHNFGPLNREGGERRLNVAVTRAKFNVQLVSSMHYTDIDLKRASSEGARLLREYLEYAEKGELALDRAISVNAFEHFDSDFEMEVCDFLRDNGFSVDPQVGCSGFRIDLGLKQPDSSDYVLAIECDGATYHSSKNARDRDRLRQEILERMGWKFYRIWSTDWFRNKSVEQQRLLEAAAQAVRSPSASKASKAKPDPCPPSESFEEAVTEPDLTFLPYKEVDVFDAFRRHHYDFNPSVRDILETEAPLSEKLLQKRLLWYFERSKVTTAVQREYEDKICGCERYGIVRKNGFLYLKDGKEIRFRTPGEFPRELREIAPEELAAGMLELIQQNVTIDKASLFRSLAALCGVTRVGKTVNETLADAFRLLEQEDRILVSDDQISLK